MLAYLDELCSALIARDQATLERLRADPAAGALPEVVRQECEEFQRIGGAGRAAPIHTLHFYYQQVHLSRELQSAQSARPRVTARAAATLVPASHAPNAPGSRASQIELPLFAA